MPNMDPIAYQDNEGIHWLQITIADNGVCTEFKQASEADMATNTWKTLEPDQWPTIIPAYDPTVSQNHFVLSRDSANKLSRHFFSKYTPPGPNQSPIDRVSNQVYLGAYWGPMTMLRDPEKKSVLLNAFWQPEEAQQAQLQTQYQRWQQSQLSVWHRDATQPDLNMANQLLDFQTAQDGTAKPDITTDLSPNQQWLVKSTIFDRVATLKAESTSSEEYRAALHFLIDGTEPNSPLSSATQKNLEDVKILIAAPGINRYMKNNFYTKIIEKQNARSLEMENERVPMSAQDPGYDVTIESVSVYIQQLLRAEILQYFPDYFVNIADHPTTLMSTFKVGALPLDQSGAIEESSIGLTQQEIRQIDDLYRLYSNTYPLIDASEESLTELYSAISSIRNRFAATQAVASTFRLLLPNNTDWQYEKELEYMGEKIQKMQRLNPLLRELLTHQEDHTPRSLNNQDLDQLTSNAPLFLSNYIRYYPEQQQSALLIRLFQKKLLSATEMKQLISILSLTNPSLKASLVTVLADTFPYPESEQYKQLYAVLTGEMDLDLNDSDAVVQDLFQIVNLIGPRTTVSTQFLEFLNTLGSPDLSVARYKIEAYYLSKNIHDFFATVYSVDKEQELAELFPKIHYGNQEILAQAIKNLSYEQQITVLRALLHHSTAIDYSAVKTAHFIQKNFDRTLIQELLENELVVLPSTERHYFTSLQSFLANDETILNVEDGNLSAIQALLDTTLPPDGGQPSKLVPLLILNEANADMDKLVALQVNVTGRLLAKEIKAYFEEPERSQTKERLNSILPNRDKKNILAMHNASKFLAAALNELRLEHQAQFLTALLNQQQLPAYIVKRLFDDESSVEFKVILDVITALSSEKIAILVNSRNAMFFLRALLNKYKQTFSREPIEFLKQLPEEMLDKLMPQIEDDELQIYLENYDLSLEELPQTNTLDWKQTAETIAALFANTKTTKVFVAQLKRANSPRELKELLLLEIRNGDYYQAENMVSIALKRLGEHESAIMNSLAPDERRYRNQLKYSGELGKSLAIELECLQGDRRGAAKLNLLKEALSQLPEKITEAELHTLLRDTHSPLCIALFTPVAPVARGFTLFEQRKPPEPDMAFVNEIKVRLEQLDQGLAAGVSSQASLIPR
ncbi:MAG: hypothetical protein KBB94_05370 [Legionellaceae bacterium]|nr:hypothetical protein [Legionellaceae bacterium]